jgi:hypothetical protein
MGKYRILACLLSLAALSACNDDSLDAVIMVDSAFQTTKDGWKAEFSEYSSLTDTLSMDTAAAVTRLPIGLDTSQYSYRIYTRNAKDNMFVYLKKKVTGFTPNATYNLVFDIAFGSKFPKDDSPGAPWNLVYLKAGASPKEPKSTLTNKVYRFNLNKGAVAQAGTDVALATDVANGISQRKYALVRHSNADKPFSVTANQQGEIWLFVGTDMNYKDSTTFYYDRITATIKEP